MVDRRCHTVSMMLTANTCLTAFGSACTFLSLSIFTLQNDLKQIYYQDSLCLLRTYFNCALSSMLYYSFLIQAVYRYIVVIYPSRFVWQSRKVYVVFICITWIFSGVYPLVFMFNGQIEYDGDNQTCLIPMQISFFVIYLAACIYLLPVTVIMFVYFKLLYYVKQMRKRVTPANILLRAQRELKMVQHIVIIIVILLIAGSPYIVFLFMSSFNSTPKYYFRIGLLFAHISLVLMMIALFRFTDPLKAALMKRITRQITVAPVTIA